MVAVPVAAALTVLVLIAAERDLRTRKIPNWLTLSGCVAGFGLNSYVSGWPGLGQSLAGAGVALAIYIVLSLFRAVGMGDVKLMAAVGALTGPGTWLILFLITSLVGGVTALIQVAWSGRVGRTFDNMRYILGEMSHLRAPDLTRGELGIKGQNAMTQPHGAMIALGTLGYLGWVFFHQ